MTTAAKSKSTQEALQTRRAAAARKKLVRGRTRGKVFKGAAGRKLRIRA